MHGLLNVLLATHEALDGAEAHELAGVLAAATPRCSSPRVAALGADDAERVRASFTAYGCCGVLDPLTELEALGLITTDATRTTEPHRLTTWLDVPADHPFGIDNLPYGVFSTAGDPTARVGVRIGDHVLDAGSRRRVGRDAGLVGDGPTSRPRGRRRASTRSSRSAARRGRPRATGSTEILRDEVHRDGVDAAPAPARRGRRCTCRSRSPTTSTSTPARTTRPTSGRSSAPTTRRSRRTGSTCRSATTAAQARSSCPGTDVVRPTGQRKGPTDPAPVFGPSIRLDIEAELGYVVGGATALGSRVSVDEAADHLFGVVVLNDWSARDIQAWEYVPLGPFLGKSFATSISAWVDPLEALAAARVPLPGQSDPQVLPYLRG